MTLGVSSVFAMGGMLDGGSPLLQIVPFVLILAIFYFIILLPAKRKQQKVQAFLDGLKVNDRIITTSGMYGQITRLGEQSVQIQIADKVRIEVSKAAVGGYQGQPPVVEPEKAN
ncbi:MAG: preprotein translocase subunit YajC [Acidobacteria bacterium]|nr:preprotein translocase subunit YajC [Acidobacteriota bacterium]